MALETGVKINLEVKGEQLLKQAFESVAIAAKGLESQGLNLSKTLKSLEGAEKEAINTYAKSSSSLKSLQKESTQLARQYEFMAKFTGVSAREAKFLASVQEDLINKAKELNYRGKVKTNFIDAENKKIVEQIRLNNQLANSIGEVSKKTAEASRKTKPQGQGDQMVALYRANEMQKQAALEKTLQSELKAAQRKLQVEAGTGDQMVALYRANEMQKQAALQKTASVQQSLTERQLRQVTSELRNVQQQAELTAKGLSKVTANGVIKLQGLGATQGQVEQFIKLRSEIEKLDPAIKKTSVSLSGMSGIIRQIIPVVGGLGLGAVLSQTAIAFIRTADSMSLLKNRMKLTLNETQNFDAVYKNLVQTSINNRTSITDTVTLFTRLNAALEGTGTSTAQVNTTVDSFQKTLLISGASVRETSSAVLQFSQALAAGKLNGDEFRSISEAAPEFLRTFSKATGVAAGSLKDLAADGVITRDVIVAAMTVMNTELSKTAQGIDLTFGQSLQILGTRLSVFVDELNSATGFTSALADATFDLSEIVKGASEFIAENKEVIATFVSVLSDGVRIVTAVGLAYAGLKVSTLALAGATGTLGIVTKAATFATTTYSSVLFAYALTGSAATTATIAFTTAIRALVASTGIGLLAVILGSVGLALYDYISASDEAKESSDNLTDSMKLQKEEIEKAQVILNNFGITYGAAGGAAGEYRKKTQELTDAYIRQKVGAEGLFLIEKNLLELKKTQVEAEARRITVSEKATADNLRQVQGLIATSNAIADQLGVLELIEQARKESEASKLSSKASEKVQKDLKKEAEAAKEAAEAYANLGYEDLFKERDKHLDGILKNVDGITSEIKSLKEQADALLLSKDALREKDLATIETALSSAEFALTEELAKKETTALTFALQDQIEKLKELKDAKKGLFTAEDQKEAQEQIKKTTENTVKEFQKIQDDIAKSITDAIAGGGQKGKDILKNMFKAQVFRIFIEPQVRNVVGSISGALGVPGASGTLDVNSIAGSLGALSTGGGLGLALNSAFKMAGEFSQSAYAFTQVGQQFAGVASGLGQLAPYAGAIASVLQGDIKGGLGSAAGTYIGGAIAGPIGAAIGSFLGSKLGGGGKISASTIDPSNFTEVKKALLEQYKNTVASLGGAVNDAVRFNVYGNTGRQGQNSNFTAFANVGNRSVFSSFDTAEGQADGLFLSGEVALNDKNLADQSLRALFSVLKETDFADNIDAVIRSANTFGDSFEKLNGILSDAQLLNTINTEFPKLGGVLATLANQSIETVKTFVALAGGVENLGNLQSAYIQAIYSEEEKLEIATDNLNKAFASLNLSVPNSTSAFRDLVESQNLSTVQGQATYLALLQVAGAFAEITKANEDLITATNLRVQQERAELEKELYDLITDNNQKLQDQRNALDESNRSLFDQIQAIKATKALREELTAKIQEQESVISEVEDKIFSIREQATQDYLTAQEKVQAAQERINQLSLETASNFLNLGKSLRDFIREQRQGVSSGGFNSTLQAALGGDAQALANLPNLAGALIGDLENTSRSSFEAQARKASILEQVSLAAAVAESLGASALQEDPMIVAQRELTAARSELSNALAVANAINAPLVQTQQNLVTEYTKALRELTAANNNLNALLGTLNLINNGGVVTPSTTIQTPNGVVSLPVAAGSTSANIAAPILEQQIAALTAKVEQLIVENRAGQQAIANNTGKSAKILERADDGDSINVRVLV